MHTYRMLFLLNLVTGLKNYGWPSVNNVTTIQSKEMTGQTSDVAVMLTQAHTHAPPPPPKKKRAKKGPPNGTVKDLKEHR